MRQKASLARRLDDRSKARLCAEAAVKQVIFDLAGDKSEGPYALNNRFSDDSSAFKDVAIGDGAVTVSYNLASDLAGGVVTRYGIVDEESKLNINTASLEALQNFFMAALGVELYEAQGIAASLVDWRDEDASPTTPTGSAEGPYYRSLSAPYEAKDAPFEVLDELVLVRGMTPEIFERVRDYFTVYSSGAVNVNTAPKVVLVALGISPSIADKILDFRYGKDGVIGTADDGVFNMPADVVPDLSHFVELSDSEVAQLSNVVGQYITTSSSVFMVNGEARLAGNKRPVRFRSVIDRGGRTLSWREW